jgi:putative hydrolase of the HAD superfamily
VTASSKKRLVVFVDADNTLWDTDGVFAKAQLQLLADVELLANRNVPERRLEYIRAVDQILAEEHHLGLRYPPRFLIGATFQALLGSPLDKSLTNIWKVFPRNSELNDETVSRIEHSFIENVRVIPSLLPGVRTGLARLSRAGVQTLVVSEGDRARVAQRLAVHELSPYVDRIIEAPKHPRLFTRVLRLAGSPQRAWMIGDQLSRDIRPAQSAGLMTIYIPGNFQPRWELKQDSIHPDHKAVSFDQAVDIILGVKHH